MFEQLATYITEDLSQEGKTLLAFLRRTGKLTDDMVKDLATKAGVNPEGDEYKSWIIDEDELDEYINSHGLGLDSIKGINSSETILKLFTSDKKSDELREILKAGGTCDFKEFLDNGLSPKSSNIFDYCKSWKKIAGELAKIDHVSATRSNARIGKYELLMRFIIRESIPPIKGDVAVNYGGSPKNMEVKASVSRTGGVLKSQDKNRSISEMTDFIYNQILSTAGLRGQHNQVGDAKIRKEVQGLDDRLKYGDGGFFKGIRTVITLQDLLNYINNDRGGKADTFGVDTNPDMPGSIFYILASAIEYMYNSVEIKIDVDALCESMARYNKRAKCITFKEGKGYEIDSRKIIDMFGAAQLYGYWCQGNFDYFCVVDGEGQYNILEKTDIIDSCNLEKILKYCEFDPNKADDGRGGSCRVRLRK